MRDKLLLFGMLMAIVPVACEGMDPVAPSDGGSEVGAASAPVIVTTVPINEWLGSGSGISGEATLTRTSDGLSVDQDVQGLTPGNAYSVWWAIWDNPRQCEHSPCEPSDLFVRAAQASLVNGGGFVATATTQFYSSELARHDVEGRQVWVGDVRALTTPMVRRCTWSCATMAWR